MCTARLCQRCRNRTCTTLSHVALLLFQIKLYRNERPIRLDMRGSVDGKQCAVLLLLLLLLPRSTGTAECIQRPTAGHINILTVCFQRGQGRMDSDPPRGASLPCWRHLEGRGKWSHKTRRKLKKGCRGEESGWNMKSVCTSPLAPGNNNTMSLMRPAGRRCV